MGEEPRRKAVVVPEHKENVCASLAITGHFCASCSHPGNGIILPKRGWFLKWDF